MNVFQTVQEDLHRVHSLVQKHYKANTEYINDFISGSFNYLDHNLRPGLIITSHRLFSPVTDQTIALATVLQYIFLASQIHLTVMEGNAGKQAREKYQLPVLMGDYLYAKAFTILCDADLTKYQRQLGQLVCIINKGGILNAMHRDTDDPEPELVREVVRKEIAEQLACATFLGADLGGADYQTRKRLYLFSLNFGMAYGLRSLEAKYEQFSVYLTAAEAALGNLPQTDKTPCLHGLLSLFDRDKQMHRMVI